MKWYELGDCISAWTEVTCIGLRFSLGKTAFKSWHTDATATKAISCLCPPGLFAIGPILLPCLSLWPTLLAPTLLNGAWHVRQLLTLMQPVKRASLLANRYL